MAWHKGKVISLNNSQEITTWRQVLTKENSLMKGKTDKELKAMENQLNNKNTYMHLFKNEEKAQRETLAEKTGRNIIYAFDQVKGEDEHSGYDPKVARDSNFKRRDMALPKDSYNSVMTTS